MDPCYSQQRISCTCAMPLRNNRECNFTFSNKFSVTVNISIVTLLLWKDNYTPKIRALNSNPGFTGLLLYRTQSDWNRNSPPIKLIWWLRYKLKRDCERPIGLSWNTLECWIDWRKAKLLCIWTLNPLIAIFFQNKHKIFPQFISFLHTDMTQVVLRLFYIVNIMGADVLTTQGARASQTMLLTMLNWNNSVPACQGLTNRGYALINQKIWFRIR